MIEGYRLRLKSCYFNRKLESSSVAHARAIQAWLTFEYLH